MQKIYIVVAIGALAVIAALMIFIKKTKPEARISPLAGLAFASIIAGIIFGENQVIGYGLLGVGVGLAVVDIVNKLKK